MNATILEFMNNNETIFSIKGESSYEAFTEVEIIFYKEDKKYIVFRDFIIEGIKSLKISLIMALASKLKKSLDEKSFGLIWNEYCKNLNLDEIADDPIKLYHLWSTTVDNGIETWIYNSGEKIYIEISSMYRWNFDETDSINLEKYEDFTKNYKPIAVLEITKQTASCWLEKCEEILAKIKQISGFC